MQAPSATVRALQVAESLRMQVMSRQRRTRSVMPPSKTDRPDTSGRLWPVLLVILLIGAGLRVAILVEHLYRNPFAYAPVTDGAMYWDWAGRIAAGQGSGQTPFVSAPLYPYLLGVLRTAGGGLAAVYVVQLVMDLLTAIGLAWIGRERFGRTVGLVAAAGWLVIDEPAFYFTRVLNSSLQVFLVVALWWLMVQWQRRRSWPTGVGTGVVLGLNCLANPPMMLLVPIVPAWMIGWALTARRRDDAAAQIRPVAAAAQAVLVTVLTLAVIAPATWHNRRACGEFIPITACPGITLRQGNGPGAVGTYVVIPGVGGGREHLFTDAARVYQQATGRLIRWRDVDAYFRDQALAYWREDPLRAAGLILRRVYWFISGRYYCDVHQPSWERDEGFARMLWLAPVQTAWLMGAGLIGLGAWLRRPMRLAPEWLLFAVPFAVVAIFQYSPRYRLPAVPIVVLAAAWAGVWAMRWSTGVRRTIAVAAATVAAIALGPINRMTGFEDPTGLAYNNEYNVSVALRKLGRSSEAIDRLERALRILPTSADAHNDLAILLAENGQLEAAVDHYERALRHRPGWAQAESNLAIACARLGRFDQAVEHAARAQRGRPDSPELAFNLANALADSGRLDEAVDQYRRALQLRPDYVDAHDHLAIVLARQGQRDRGIEHWQQALRIDPGRIQTRNRLAVALAEAKRYADAIALLRGTLRQEPDDLTAANNLAWLLATCPRDELRNGAEALALAERICQQTDHRLPAALDSLAAAYAENGRFDQAVETVGRALSLTQERKDADQRKGLSERLERYRRGQPYREKY